MLDEELFVAPLLLLLDFFCLLLEDEEVVIDGAVKGSTGRLDEDRDG